MVPCDVVFMPEWRTLLIVSRKKKLLIVICIVFFFNWGLIFRIRKMESAGATLIQVFVDHVQRFGKSNVDFIQEFD